MSDEAINIGSSTLLKDVVVHCVDREYWSALASAFFFLGLSTVGDIANCKVFDRGIIFGPKGEVYVFPPEDVKALAALDDEITDYLLPWNLEIFVSESSRRE